MSGPYAGNAGCVPQYPQTPAGACPVCFGDLTGPAAATGVARLDLT